jgi:flagellar biosynthetic protein FliR
VNQLIFITQEALYLVLVCSGPPVVISLVVGLLIAVFQATTQIQEQTLTFAPKMVIVFVSPSRSSTSSRRCWRADPEAVNPFQNQLEQIFADLGYKTSLSLTIIAVALIACRVLPLCFMSPFLGGDQIDPQIKIGIGVLLSILMFPAVEPRIHELPVNALFVVLLIMKEVFIGMTLAFIVSFTFEAAKIAGNLVDVMSGAQMAQVMAPMIQQQATLYSTYKMMVATALFLTLNGHHLVIETLAESVMAIPLDQFPRFSRGMFGYWDTHIRIFGDMLRIGIILSGPGMIATFLTDLAMGMINRVATQLQVFFVAMAIKPLMAAAMTFMVIYMILDRMRLEFGHMLALLQDAVRMLQ